MERENSRYPRSLSAREQSWLEWILPADRPGYNEYREELGNMMVLGPGRRGVGNIVLGYAGDVPDTTSPLPPVFAYGVIESSVGSVLITLRENVGDQIDVEIVGQQSDEVPETFEERRRWTYSMWSPGDACPQCGLAIRKVLMHTESSQTPMVNKHFVLAICPVDKRIWMYDGASRVNRLIPVTNFYNELMLHKNIRDPKIALDSRRFFTELQSYGDAELTYAFLTYNKLKTKVEVRGSLVAESKDKIGLGKRLMKIFVRN